MGEMGMKYLDEKIYISANIFCTKIQNNFYLVICTTPTLYMLS